MELEMAKLLELDPQELRDVASMLGLLTNSEATTKEVLRLIESAQLSEVAIGQ